MTRLQRMIKVVEQERAAVAESRNDENLCSLHRCQQRLLNYIARSNNTAPYDLFFTPEPVKIIDGKTYILSSVVHDELTYVQEK